MNSFIELLKRQFEDNRKRRALIYDSEALSYEALAKRAERVGAFLQDQGMQKRDIVVLYLQEKPAFLILHLGIILAGGVSLPLNFNFTRDEMAYFLNDSGARYLFADGKQAELVKSIKDRCPRLQALLDPGIAHDMNVGRGFREVEIRAEDPCFMLYSSGTTGRPKGVLHSHANTAASLLSLKECWRFTPDDVLLNVLPLFHIHGLSFAAHLSLVSGSAMIIEYRFHPLKTLDRIKGATVFMGVPTFYYAFMKRPEFKQKTRRWRSTRLFTCGSAPIRVEVLDEIEAIIGKPLINRYGMTESHVIASLPLAGPHKRGSVGLPLAGVDVSIGNETGVGEVKVSSKNLFSHYWNREQATKEAFDERGFFDTGDLGYLDEDGFLFLVGRKDDMIITSGYNVYPAVVERVIDEFPGIEESAVIGVPDAGRGDKVAAVIVPERGAAIDIRALKKHCRQRLVDYQCPLTFEIVDTLPRNTMGKVLKRRLKK